LYRDERFGERAQSCPRGRPCTLAFTNFNDPCVSDGPGAFGMGSPAGAVCAERHGRRSHLRLADVLRTQPHQTGIEFNLDILDDLVLAWAVRLSGRQRRRTLVLCLALQSALKVAPFLSKKTRCLSLRHIDCQDQRCARYRNRPRLYGWSAECGAGASADQRRQCLASIGCQ